MLSLINPYELPGFPCKQPTLVRELADKLCRPVHAGNTLDAANVAHKVFRDRLAHAILPYTAAQNEDVSAAARAIFSKLFPEHAAAQREAERMREQVVLENLPRGAV